MASRKRDLKKPSSPSTSQSAPVASKSQDTQATFPASIAELVKCLASVGVQLESMFAGDPIVSECVRGRMICRPVRVWDYRCWNQPWDCLVWFATGTGGTDGRGAGGYGFNIDLSKLPKSCVDEIRILEESIFSTANRADQVQSKCAAIAAKARDQAYRKAAKACGLVDLQRAASKAQRARADAWGLH